MKIKIIKTGLRCWLAGSLFLFALSVQSAEVAARLGWAELHYASVPVNGFVDSVFVQVGQRVNKGEKLFALNTAVLSAKVKQAQARVAAAYPALTDAQREYRDAQALYEQTVLSDVELQHAKMAFDIANAKLGETKALLTEATVKLSRATQYAPWAAWVINRNIESGQVITGDLRIQPLIVLARADARLAVAQVSYEVLSQLQLGQAIKVRYRGQDYTGSVQSMAMTPGDAAGQSYALKVVFAVDPGGLFKPGDSVSLLLP